MTSVRTVAVLQGDQTGQELLDQALRVLRPDVLGFTIDFLTFDLSLQNRRSTSNKIVLEAGQAVHRCGFGLKAATVTPETPGDVGTPNAILREEMDGKVILRTGHRIPGIAPRVGVSAPIAVVRMAVDDAYLAKEWREGEGLDEVAYRTEKITRRTCRAVAEFAFIHAERTGAKVFGGPKYTVSATYEGMFKEEMDLAAQGHPNVRYEPQLIDATYALLLGATDEALVVPALNRDGDCLSDFVLEMFGSIAGAQSEIYSFNEDFSVRAVLAEAVHGTAPRLQGKDVANPMAMILAGAALLSHFGDEPAERAAQAIRDAVFGAVRDGVRTVDLGGDVTTTYFTEEVISRVRARLS